MCDINKETRRRRYQEILKLGYTRGWAQRVRDFSDARYESAKTRGS